MSLLFRLVLSLGMLGLGLLLLVKTEQFVRMVGLSSWAETKLGGGGTYSLWKTVGVLLAFGSVVVLFWLS